MKHLEATKPTISVVIPTYRRQDKLARAIKSIQNQTYPCVEIIIVNDSPDEEITISIPNNARVLNNSRNQGASYSRNRGIISSKGKFIAFLDDDDVWHPDKLRRQMDALTKHNSEYGFVFTGASILAQSGERRSILPDVDGYIHQKLLSGNVNVPSVTPLVRRNCFAEVGLFDPSLQSCQDLDMWVRLSRVYKAKSVPQELTEIFQNHQKPRISTNHEKQYNGKKRFLEKHNEELEKVPGQVGKYHIDLGVHSLYMGEQSLARFHLLKAYEDTGIRLTLFIHFLLSYFPNKVCSKFLALKSQF